MSSSSPAIEPATEVSRLLSAWRQGEPDALDRLMPLVYRELHRLAHAHLRRERAGHTLQTTALIHEVYLRLAGKDRPRWQGRRHFFAVAAQLMRRILVDWARRRCYAKRGGGAAPLPIEAAEWLAVDRASELVALDDALGALASFDPGLVRLVELRFFAGLDIAETAEVLGVSASTVSREWRLARDWLYGELAAGGEPAAAGQAGGGRAGGTDGR
jgi:RNA polymerase sigma factor (TIGR02999 family)